MSAGVLNHTWPTSPARQGAVRPGACPGSASGMIVTRVSHGTPTSPSSGCAPGKVVPNVDPQVSVNPYVLNTSSVPVHRRMSHQSGRESGAEQQNTVPRDRLAGGVAARRTNRQTAGADEK
jgi:hypothetical protein